MDRQREASMPRHAPDHRSQSVTVSFLRKLPQKHRNTERSRQFCVSVFLWVEVLHVNARSTSASKSSTSSTPHDNRTSPSVIPRCALRSGSTDAWVIDAG